MSLPWFRFYHEFSGDPVVQCLAFDDQRHYVMVLCLKASGFLDKPMPSGDFRQRAICRSLGLDSISGMEAQRRLREIGLIDKNWQPINWDKRQFLSDSSATRVKKYREKREINGLPRSSDSYRKHWAALMKRDGGKCVYCGSQDGLCVDHIIPISQGGTDDFDNLAVACKACNSGKSGRTPAQAGYKQPVTVSVTPSDTDKETDTEFEKYLAAFRANYPRRAGSQPWRKAEKAIRARIYEGSTWTDLTDGARRYSEFCGATGKSGTEYVMQAATFCGPDKPFLQTWDLPPPKAPRLTKYEQNMSVLDNWNPDDTRTDEAALALIGPDVGKPLP